MAIDQKRKKKQENLMAGFLSVMFFFFLSDCPKLERLLDIPFPLSQEESNVHYYFFLFLDFTYKNVCLGGHFTFNYVRDVDKLTSQALFCGYS